MRRRNKNGQFRNKRSDTHLSTLDKMYGEISRKRGNTHLATLRKSSGKSLSKIV